MDIQQSSLWKQLPQCQNVLQGWVHIFRDSYGSGMGIVWETYHKRVPVLGVGIPENPTECLGNWFYGSKSLTIVHEIGLLCYSHTEKSFARPKN